MKNTIFLLLILSAFSLQAQVKWHSYRSSEFKFNTRFPSEFQISKSEKNDSLTWLEVSSELETMLFSVSVRQSPDPITPVNASYLAAKALNEFTITLDAQKLKDYKVKAGDREGVGAELLLMSGGTTASVRAFANKGYIYILYVIQLHPGADESVQKKFFDSFKLL